MCIRDRLLDGHLLAPVPTLAPRAVVLDALEELGDVELLVGVERRHRTAGRAGGLVAHAAPPHFCATTSQPSPAASRRAASGAGQLHVVPQCSTTCPAPCPNRPRFSHSPITACLLYTSPSPRD